MLNWRPVREIEARTRRLKESEEQIKSDILQIKSDILQIESDILQVEKETEQLRQENAKGRALLSCVDQLCFPPESSSIPPPATESNCGPSSS